MVRGLTGQDSGLGKDWTSASLIKTVMLSTKNDFIMFMKCEQKKQLTLEMYPISYFALLLIPWLSSVLYCPAKYMYSPWPWGPGKLQRVLVQGNPNAARKAAHLLASCSFADLSLSHLDVPCVSCWACGWCLILPLPKWEEISENFITTFLWL